MRKRSSPNPEKVMADARKIDFSANTARQLLDAASEPIPKPLEVDVAVLMELAKRFRLRREAKAAKGTCDA